MVKDGKVVVTCEFCSSVYHSRRKRRRGVGLAVITREHWHLETCDCIEECPLSGVTRKTFAHTEFFSV